MYSTTRYCIVQYSTVYCTILYCTVMYGTLLYSIVQYCRILYRKVLIHTIHVVVYMRYCKVHPPHSALWDWMYPLQWLINQLISGLNLQKDFRLRHIGPLHLAFYWYSDKRGLCNWFLCLCVSVCFSVSHVFFLFSNIDILAV